MRKNQQQQQYQRGGREQQAQSRRIILQIRTSMPESWDSIWVPPPILVALLVSLSASISALTGTTKKKRQDPEVDQGV